MIRPQSVHPDMYNNYNEYVNV